MSIMFGWHAVFAALNNPQMPLKTVYVAGSRRKDRRLQQMTALALEKNVPLVLLSGDDMTRRWGDRHQGFAAEFGDIEVVKTYTEDDIEDFLIDRSEALFLILDGVQDPHNVGACLRSAAAAGVCCVIAPKDKSAGLTPIARKVACGAAEVVPFIQVTNLARVIKKLQAAGVWFFGLDQHAEKSLYETQFSGHIALIMGSEEHGMRRLTAESCDALISIPMSNQHIVESLNVSVATGVTLFEIVRQRVCKK